MDRMASRVGWGLGALLLTASWAEAGALDRTGQPVTVLFEDGNYAELSYGFTTPDVEGGFGPVSSGNVGEDFSVATLALKYDLTDRLSLGLVVDQPFGVDVDYGDADLGYPIGGTTAEFSSTSVTALARYRINDGFSVHGGLRYVTVDANLDLFSTAVPVPGVPAYAADYASDSDLGYVVGAAYEREAIGLRVALTYSSETKFQNDVAYTAFTPVGPLAFAGTTNEYTLPQSVNLDARTGIAAGTALIATVRWVDWSETVIASPDYPANPVVDYEGDYVTTTLGVGRQFGERFRAAASLLYETEIGGPQSDLSPYDGQRGIVLGGTYLVGNGLEVTGGVRFARLGDSDTNLGARFEDNTSTSYALRVGYRF